MTDFSLSTPVAFIIFNRPDTTEQVFNEIAKAKPPKLLVIADGPRKDKEGEGNLVAQARAIIDRVDWDCEVLTNYSETNLGCKLRVSSGLDWVFDQVPEAIVLEDDCLPHSDFFRFCEELLVRYRNEKRIGMISGCNFQFGAHWDDNSYYFSRYNHIWGWASWSDRWNNNYDVSMSTWPNFKKNRGFNSFMERPQEAKFWKKNFEKVYKGEIDTWDYQWTFACWQRNMLTILPCNNLISNIGFGVGATHTTSESYMAEMVTDALKFPLVHPGSIERNKEADNRSSERVYCPTQQSSLVGRIKRAFGK